MQQATTVSQPPRPPPQMVLVPLPLTPASAACVQQVVTALLVRPYHPNVLLVPTITILEQKLPVIVKIVHLDTTVPGHAILTLRPHAKQAIIVQVEPPMRLNTSLNQGTTPLRELVG